MADTPYSSARLTIPACSVTMSAVGHTSHRVLVIGSGWVGSGAARAVTAQGGTVAVIDIPTHPWLADRDTGSTAALRSELSTLGATAVINTAGLLRGSDDAMQAANVAFPTWLVGALGDADVRLVHIGSAAEYGDPGSAAPIPETAPCAPTAAYGITKHAGTRAVLAARDRGLDAVVGRGFNLVGEHLPPSSPLGQWLTDVAALPISGGMIEVWESATFRDFVLLEDLSAGLAALAMAPEVPDLVNLSSSTGLYYGEIVEALVRAAGKSAEIRSLDQGGIMAVVGDNSRLESIAGIDPQMSLQLVADRATL